MEEVIDIDTMKIRFPSFLENFSCIGGACKHNCCIGWELDVDAATYAYYQTVPGEIGKRLRQVLQQASDNEYSFVLPVNGRCPFLNQDNLCDLVLSLGESSLCDICQTYPRYRFSYGDYVDLSLTISCEEACRLLLKDSSPLTFITTSYDEDTHPSSLMEDESTPSKEEVTAFLKKEESLFALVANRNVPFYERLNALLSSYKNVVIPPQEKRLFILSSLEPIDKEWVHYLKKLSAITTSASSRNPSFFNQNGSKKDSPYEDIYAEKLLLYFFFRYLPRSLFDYNLSLHIQFCLFCLFCIYDLYQVQPNIQEAASLFSREVEHSEDNIDMIIEELLFSLS